MTISDTGVLDYSPSEEVMPSRRCPHCKVMSSYERGTGGIVPLFERQPQRWIRFDVCRNEECGCAVAVVSNERDSDQEIDVYPALDEEPDALLPEDVGVAFGQALRSLNERIWDGCVTMARRALQEAVSNLKAEGRDLYDQIENLADAGRITPDLKEWAHEGRLGGNLGAHGDKDRKWSDKADAEEIVEFAKWFFRYVYILPRQLAQRRERLSDQVQKDPEAA